MRKRSGTILLCVLLGAVLSGCPSSQSGLSTDEVETADVPAEVWAVSDMVALSNKLPAYQDYSILDDRGETLRLFAAANETVSVQVVVDAPSDGLAEVTVHPSELRGVGVHAIPAEQIDIFRMLPVRVHDVPAWYIRLAKRNPRDEAQYDPLVPLDAPVGGQPYRLRPRERLALWVDITIPRNLPGDEYSGTLEVRVGNKRLKEYRVEVKVYDFLLPDSRPFAILGAFDHRTLFRQFVTRDGKPFEPTVFAPDHPEIQAGLEYYDQLMQLAHEHRLDLFDRQLQPKPQRDAQGRLTLDWSAFDAVAKPYLTGEAFSDRVGVSGWAIPITEDWPVPDYYGGADGEMYVRTVETITKESANYFRGLGVEEQMFAWPVRAEPDPSQYARYRSLAEMIRRADDGVALLSRLPLQPPAGLENWPQLPRLERFVDILAPPAHWLDPRRAEEFRTPRNPLAGIWITPGRPPFLPSLSVLATPTGVRAIPWFVQRYDCTGLFLPEVLNWNGRVFESPDGAETRLFYPGREIGLDRILPSVRLKRLRRGLQDTQYLWILRQRQKSEFARAIIQSMVRYAGLEAVGEQYLDPRVSGWVQDGEAWIFARRMLADEISQTIHPRVLSEQEKLAQRLRLDMFRKATHKLRIDEVQTFLRPGPSRLEIGPDGQPVESPVIQGKLRVSLRNEFPDAKRCTLEVVGFPAGWNALRGPQTIESLAPDTTDSVNLFVQGATIPSAGDGKLPFVVRLSADGLADRDIELIVPYLVARPTEKPPHIDGHLEDWPAGRFHTATGFRLLGARGEDSTLGLATQQTYVSVLQDESYVYFAIRAQEPNLTRLTVQPDNFLRYEQLLASGEDIVEIILDPTGRAKTRDELYHFAIKPNGIMIQEQGVGEPAQGNAKPINTGANVAVGREETAWTVELRIPRAAFGRSGRTEPFWRVNFSRFRVQAMEASSWTGAPRHFYDPGNLGTMFVKPVITP